MKHLKVGINILNNYLNKTINLSHCSAIVFSKELAEKGIGNIVNSLSTNNEIRPDAYILISSKSAYDVLDKVANSGEKFSSRFYEYIIQSANYTGYSGKVTFEEFSSKINSPTEDTIAIYTNVDTDTVQNVGLAIFKDDKMVGNVDVLDSIAHLTLSHEIQESLITIPNPFESGSYVDLEIKSNKKPKIHISMINNTPFITCDLELNGNIRTSGKNFDYTSNENINILEYYAKKYIEDIILNYLYKISKEYNADVLEFQRILSMQTLTNSDLENYNFSKVFKDSFFQVNVDLQIESTHLFSKK